MRILQLISSIGFFGAENVVLEIAKELQHKNFQPIVGVFENRRNRHLELAEQAKRQELRVAIFPCDYKLDPKVFGALRRFLREERIDILHTHNYKSNFYALTASLGLSIPLITTCHTWFGKTFKMKAFFRLDKSLLNRFDKIVTVSDAIKEEVLLNRVTSKKIVTISNGIDINKFSGSSKGDNARKELGIAENYKIVGAVGRLTEQKGFVYLLGAAKRIVKQYPRTIILIVGEGPLKKSLMQHSEGLNVVFAGLRNDMPDIYSLMDIFVLPSIDEGLPMALLEAMACKIPAVATRVGNVPEVITEKTGFLVEPRDENQIADSLLYLLANEEKAKVMGENSRIRVRDFFSSTKMAEEYTKLYREVFRRSKEMK